MKVLVTATLAGSADINVAPAQVQWHTWVRQRRPLVVLCDGFATLAYLVIIHFPIIFDLLESVQNTSV